VGFVRMLVLDDTLMYCDGILLRVGYVRLLLYLSIVCWAFT